MFNTDERDYRSLTPSERVGLLLRNRLRDTERAAAAAADMDSLRAERGQTADEFDSVKEIRRWRESR